jgi:hypothetical protein
MSRVLRRLATTDVDTAVPMAGPAKALTVGTRASGETSNASLAELKEPTRSQPFSNVYINVCIRDEHENIWELRGETSWRGTHVSPHNRSAAG